MPFHPLPTPVKAFLAGTSHAKLGPQSEVCTGPDLAGLEEVQNALHALHMLYTFMTLLGRCRGLIQPHGMLGLQP